MWIVECGVVVWWGGVRKCKPRHETGAVMNKSMRLDLRVVGEYVILVLSPCTNGDPV